MGRSEGVGAGMGGCRGFGNGMFGKWRTDGFFSDWRESVVLGTSLTTSFGTVIQAYQYTLRGVDLC